MQLDRMTARIAPRSAWQAMDLGARLYQQWFRPLTLIWLACSLPPFLLVMLVAGSEHYWWGMLVLWWCKPVWERPLLAYASHALFDEQLSVREVLRRWPQHTLSGLLPWLLWRRLDPSRSFHLPVTQLEGQRSSAYNQRTRALAFGPSNHSGTLTVLMFHIEQFIAFGLLMLIAMLQPDQYYLDNMGWILEDSDTGLWLSMLCWYLALAICEPLYVCCGFALYLNKRTWLEGWDLEIGLRRIGARRRLHQASVLLPLLCLLGALLSPPPAYAQAETDPDASVQNEAIEIVAGPDFTSFSVEQGWRLRDFDADRADDDTEDDGKPWYVRLIDKLIGWLFDAPGGDTPDDGWSWPSLADVLRFLMWVLVISLVAWLLFNARGWLRALPQGVRRHTPLTHVSGLDIREESLPADIPAEVRRALASNNPREALSLLYRATLSRLLAMLPVDLHAGATESECLRALQAVDQAHVGVQLLARLTPMWISTAWAHRPPANDDIALLASDWQQQFGTRGIA